jgi:hypothetical protein
VTTTVTIDKTTTGTEVAPGVIVDFDITGPNSSESDSRYTQSDGVATFTYTSDGTSGTDDIDASIVGCYTAASEQVEKVWFRLFRMWPLFDINPINSDHTVKASIIPPVPNVEVCFEVTGANTASGCDLTNSFGIADFTYTGTLPGTDFIRAYIDEDGSGYYDVGEHTLCYQAMKFWLVEFVTGGGHISNGKGKTAAEKISFGGNVGYDDALTLHGQWNIEFHDVTGGPEGDKIDNSHFHSTSIDMLTFQRLPRCPSPDPPDAYFNWANFIATGRFKSPGKPWEDGWKVDVRVADFGEGKNATDSIRILLYDNFNNLVYDSWAYGDFIAEDMCGFPYSFRHQLDGGNLQIHHGTK